MELCNIGENLVEGFYENDDKDGEILLLDIEGFDDMEGEAAEILLPDVDALNNNTEDKERVCQKCGWSADDDAIFCEFCGTNIEIPELPAELKEKPRFCSNCGKPLTESAKFCGYCGSPI